MQLFSKPNCVPCEQLKRFLKEQGAEYEEYDITDERSQRMIDRYHIRSAPTLFIGSQRFVGFNHTIAKNIEAILND